MSPDQVITSSSMVKLSINPITTSTNDVHNSCKKNLKLNTKQIKKNLINVVINLNRLT